MSATKTKHSVSLDEVEESGSRSHLSTERTDEGLANFRADIVPLAVNGQLEDFAAFLPERAPSGLISPGPCVFVMFQELLAKSASELHVFWHDELHHWPNLVARDFFNGSHDGIPVLHLSGVNQISEKFRFGLSRGLLHLFLLQLGAWAQETACLRNKASWKFFKGEQQCETAVCVSSFGAKQHLEKQVVNLPWKTFLAGVTFVLRVDVKAKFSPVRGWRLLRPPATAFLDGC